MKFAKKPQTFHVDLLILGCKKFFLPPNRFAFCQSGEGTSAALPLSLQRFGPGELGRGLRLAETPKDQRDPGQIGEGLPAK